MTTRPILHSCILKCIDTQRRQYFSDQNKSQEFPTPAAIEIYSLSYTQGSALDYNIKFVAIMSVLNPI